MSTTFPKLTSEPERNHPPSADSSQVEDHSDVVVQEHKGWSVRRVVWVILLIVAILVVYKLVRVGSHSWTIYQNVSTLRHLSSEGDQTAAQSADPNTARQNKIVVAQQSIHQIAQAVSGIHSELRWFAPLLRRMNWLPGIGPSIAATPDLFNTGHTFTTIADTGFTLLAPALNQEPRIPALLAQLQAQQAQFVALADQAQRGADVFLRVPLRTLQTPLGDKAETLQSMVTLVPGVLRLSPILPQLLGMDQQRTYLVLVQNNHELRATGGFISAVGRLTIQRGKVADLDFVDSYEVYDQDTAYPPAPLPMQRYMNIPLMLFRDGNWSPDLSTSAQTIKALYFQDTGIAVDGIITLDLNAVRILVGALGSLDVAGADTPITSENIVEQIKSFWENPQNSENSVSSSFDKEWWERRKDFVPLLAKTALNRIQTGDVNLMALLLAGITALDQRAIQVWINEPQTAALLTAQGWDGSLQPEPGGDFIALVDTNVGYNKVDSVLKRTLHYKVEWPTGVRGPAKAIVEVTYHHPFAVPEENNCDPTPRYGNTYDEMAGRCYFDYVRLYATAGSKLISIEGVEKNSVVRQRGEKGTQLFAGYFVMKPGSKQTITFTYLLPDRIQPDNYRLMIQRQSGLANLPTTIQVGESKYQTDLVTARLRWKP